MDRVLSDVEALIVDMDGVLWRGSAPLPGLSALFDHLAEHHIPFVLATNNASRTPSYYVARLARLGVTIGEDQVVTSALATADWLKRALPPAAPIFVIGQEGLRSALNAAGFRLLDSALESEPSRPGDELRPDAGSGSGGSSTGQVASEPPPRLASAAAVVVGIDFDLTYRALRDATLLIGRGARFIGTNGDLTYPSELGLVPGAGAILAAVQAATGVTPTVIGKPERHLFDLALRRLGSRADRTAMLGDRLDTDILGGKRAGLMTILVTTGVDDAEAAQKAVVQPDLVVSDLNDLVARWRAARHS